ncbi:hypothetical protein PAMP_003371 [Pampus punctatissimus]
MSLKSINVSTDRTVESKFVNSLGSALDVGHKKARAVYSVLEKQKSGSESQTAIPRRHDVINPKQKMVKVICGKLNKNILKEQYAVLEPNENAPWSAGLQVKQQLVQLFTEDKATSTVVVENNTDDDIRLQNRTVLGWLYAVDAVKNAE